MTVKYIHKYMNSYTFNDLSASQIVYLTPGVAVFYFLEQLMTGFSSSLPNPTHLIRAKRNSLKLTCPFRSQSISSAHLKNQKNLTACTYSKKFILFQDSSSKVTFLLKRVLVMCVGDLSNWDSLFIALTMSFLFNFPSPFLSKNINASIIASNVDLSCGEPSSNFWKKLEWLTNTIKWGDIFRLKSSRLQNGKRSKDLTRDKPDTR